MATLAAIDISKELFFGDVSLRKIRVSDSAKILQLLNDNRGWLQKWEATLPGQTEEGKLSRADVKYSIRRLLQRHKKGGLAPFVTLYRGEIVGQLSVSEIAYGALSTAQLGYWISEEYAGRGITPRAVALAIDHMILSEGLHRIEICLRPENGASRRVVQKLGLRYEGRREKYIHIAGDWRDHECYAIVAEELGPGLQHRLRHKK